MRARRSANGIGEAMPVEAVANLAGEGSWSLEALYGDPRLK